MKRTGEARRVGKVGARPPRSSTATSGPTSHSSAQFLWMEWARRPAGPMCQRGEGWAPGTASYKALGKLVLGCFTDKRFCCGGKGQHQGSMGLGTCARRKGEA